jgi:hypothetical protein
MTSVRPNPSCGNFVSTNRWTAAGSFTSPGPPSAAASNAAGKET